MARTSGRMRRSTGLSDRKSWEKHRQRHQRQLQQQQHQQEQDSQSPSDKHDPPYSRQHPALLIPEVLISIARYLDSYSILQSVLVCHQWHSLLLPRMWSSVELDSQSRFRRLGHIITPAAFLKHAHLVQKLEIVRLQQIESQQQEPQEPRLTIHCLNLKTLILPVNWHPRKHAPENIHAARQSSLLSLIKRHQSTIEVLRLGTSIFSEELLEVLAACPRLRRLDQVDTFHNKSGWTTRQYEQLWSYRLNALRLLGPKLAELESPFDTSPLNPTNPDIHPWSLSSERRMAPSATSRTQIRKLDIEWSDCRPEFYEVPLRMVLNSPQLTRLKWTCVMDEFEGSTDLFPIAKLAQAASQQQQQQQRLQLRHRICSESSSTSWLSSENSFCPRLTSLALPHADFAIKDFETLIGALPALTDLSLDSTNFDDHCFQILKNVDQGRYGTTLTELSIKHCENFSGRFIHEVLCNFAALQVFKADTLFYSDLLQDEREHGGQRRPWVCLGLKTLSLFFKRISDPHTASSENVAPAVPSDGTSVVNNTVETTSTPATTTSMITSTSPTFESLLFPRVATLEQLETLDMANYQSLRPPEIIRLDLEHGLDQLKTLKRLRVLKGFNSFRNQVAHWDEAEAHWVLKHWPRFETLTDIALTDKAKKILGEEGDVYCQYCIVYSKEMEERSRAPRRIFAEQVGPISLV